MVSPNQFFLLFFYGQTQLDSLSDPLSTDMHLIQMGESLHEKDTITFLLSFIKIRSKANILFLRDNITIVWSCTKFAEWNCCCEISQGLHDDNIGRSIIFGQKHRVKVKNGFVVTEGRTKSSIVTHALDAFCLIMMK